MLAVVSFMEVVVSIVTSAKSYQ